MSGPQLLAAVIAAFVVTQLAIFTTTVFLHRGLTHRALTVHPVVAFPYARDVSTDRFDRLAFDYSLVGLGIGITILVLVMWALGFGLLTGFVAAGMHAVLYVMLAGAINAVGHRYGEQPYDNSATNLGPLALVTGGEGLHNNHHAAPTSARFSLHRGEIDPGWWVVRALVALRLAHVRHEDVHLKRAA
jgi:stearoyl-CoA desaturase (Delta-9 desaturase)